MAIPTEVCRRWFGADLTPSPLRGGLSGGTTWSVTHEGRRFVLKGLVAPAGRGHLAWVHEFMEHVRAARDVPVPAVAVGLDGDTVQADAAGGLWELVEWLPGHATVQPSAGQAAAAAAVLAWVHRTAVAWPGQPVRRDQSPGVLHRVARARDLLARPWATRLASGARGPLLERFVRAVETFAERGGQEAVARVAKWESRPVPLQPVLRDVWSDHVLFVDDRVTGMIDWHAAGIDTPATDIARLLGSWPRAAVIRREFLASYEAVRPLEPEEARLVPFLQATGTLFGLDNWFRWLMEEKRPFADTCLVESRVDVLLGALPDAVETLVGSEIDRTKTSQLEFFHENKS